MKHIILICHKDHLFSGSVNFIKQLFEKDFSVDVITNNLSLQHIQSFFDAHSKSVFVLWQMEHLAPWLVSKGLKVCVFPMYDGCAVAPKSYFRILDRTYLFNFSKKLHEKCIEAGVVSYQLNYYPEVDDSYKNYKKRNSLFYWLRRPKSSLAENVITDVFSPYVDNIHIHDRQDAYNIKNDIFKVSNSFSSISTWFDNKEDLKELIASSKFYLAPRESEGIGMAFLEAMSLGCIVFANKSSTHDQYIYNGYNGFLIDFSSRDLNLIKQQIKDAFEIINSGKDIGGNARSFILEGQLIWEEQANKILKTMHVIHDTVDFEIGTYKEQKLAYILAKAYKIHLKIYYVLLKIFMYVGFFNDKVVKIRLKGFLKIVLTILKKLKNVKK